MADLAGFFTQYNLFGFIALEIAETAPSYPVLSIQRTF